MINRTHRFTPTTRSFLALALIPLALLASCGGQGPINERHRADEALRGQRYDEAVTRYATYLAERPGEAEARNAYGRALLASNDPINAVEQLKTAHYQEPTNAKYLDDLCDAMIKANQSEDMFRMLRSYTDSIGTTDNWLRLGTFAQRAGDPDTAKTALLTAARIDRGQSVAPQVALYDLYLSVGDKAEANRRLRMAFFLDPKNSDVVSRMSKSADFAGTTYGLRPDEQTIR
ncbi:MAG: hypothetical protein K2X32_10460 [Phycisphaerales bacterium]|nr:hypothetical protein [Phycisphaerales bacterium]